VQRLNQRQGFLFSAIVHLAVLMALGSHVPTPVRPLPPVPLRREERTERIFLPPPEVLRQVLPPSVGPRPKAAPRATPPPAGTKDKISIGPPVAARPPGPLLLRREDDLTQVPKGQPNAVPTPTPAPAEPADARTARTSAPPEPLWTEGLRLPPASGSLPRADESRRRTGGTAGPSIASSLRGLERRLQENGPLGLPSGTGQQMGPLFFDPEGADFTLWINNFKNEVYRNWIVPQPALLGFRGHVDLEFTVERDGRLTNLRMLKGSGTTALDRAAENALLGSRLMPLPADFGPPRVSMQVSFFYNEGPRGT
jgi:TonB family protein